MIYLSSDRGLVSTARATAMAVVMCFGAAAPVVAADQSSPAAPAMTPAPAMKPAPAMTPVKGEFDNSVREGLASGQLVKTDCSVNWTAPDGKIYCFALETSKEAFLKNPDENIQKAREFRDPGARRRDAAPSNSPRMT